MTTFPLKGRRALVTGGGSGIGRAAAAINREVGRPAVEVRVADVGDESAVSALFDALAVDGGRLDILICNAGINPARTRGVGEMAVADWDQVIAVNLRGAFLCCRAALPLLRGSSAGRIVFINSIAGHVTPDRNSPAYRASKHALRSLATTLAKDLADTAVRVSSVMPGTVATAMIDPAFAAPSPFLDAGDVAEAVLFLITRSNEVVVPEIIIAPRFETAGTSSPYR